MTNEELIQAAISSAKSLVTAEQERDAAEAVAMVKEEALLSLQKATGELCDDLMYQSNRPDVIEYDGTLYTAVYAGYPQRRTLRECKKLVIEKGAK